MSKILPEIKYELENLSMEEITEAYETGTAVTGFVTGISVANELVYVQLGHDITAIMPFSEATIYPLRYNPKRNPTIPTDVKCLLKCKVRVKITSINDDKVIVSRRKNMIVAYNQLQNCKQLSMYVTQVIPRTAFGDIGDGIVGKIYLTEVCKCHIHNVKDIISKRSTIDVVVINFGADHQVSVSYKQAFKPYCKEDYNVGDVIEATIGNWIRISNTSCYYANVTPQVCGILDINQHIHLDYGCKVKCVVTGASDKGLYLDLMQVL